MLLIFLLLMLSCVQLPRLALIIAQIHSTLAFSGLVLLLVNIAYRDVLERVIMLQVLNMKINFVEFTLQNLYTTYKYTYEIRMY